jgi:hypothetical protein
MRALKFSLALALSATVLAPLLTLSAYAASVIASGLMVP